MKTLVITTGYIDIVLKRWLPLLRTNGCYKDDVLVIDYGSINYGSTPYTNEEVLKLLNKEENVKIIQAIKKMNNIFIDRVKVCRDYLIKYGYLYDVVMIVDCNDIIFRKSILPLIEMAKTDICYVKEHPSNLLRIWDDFYTREYSQKYFKSIEDNPIINGGMIIGPTKNINEILNLELDLVNRFGQGPSDQYYFNLLIYYYNYKPSRELGYEWNYTHAVIGMLNNRHIGPRRAIFKDGKAYAVEDGREIIIEHRTGTGFWYWQSPHGLELLKRNKPIPIDAEYDGSLNYFKAHFEAERGLAVNREWYRKFRYPC